MPCSSFNVAKKDYIGVVGPILSSCFQLKGSDAIPDLSILPPPFSVVFFISLHSHSLTHSLTNLPTTANHPSRWPPYQSAQYNFEVNFFADIFVDACSLFALFFLRDRLCIGIASRRIASYYTCGFRHACMYYCTHTARFCQDTPLCNPIHSPGSESVCVPSSCI